MGRIVAAGQHCRRVSGDGVFGETESRDRTHRCTVSRNWNRRASSGPGQIIRAPAIHFDGLVVPTVATGTESVCGRDETVLPRFYRTLTRLRSIPSPF